MDILTRKLAALRAEFGERWDITVTLAGGETWWRARRLMAVQGAWHPIGEYLTARDDVLLHRKIDAAERAALESRKA